MNAYQKIGLVSTGEMFAEALGGGYALPAYNFINMEQLQAVVQASLRSRSPVILQVSKNIRRYAGPELVRSMVKGALDIVRQSPNPVPVALNLDHGDSFELCVSCIEDGFSSVMIDGSALPFDENIALTRRVVDYAHSREVAVEGELGVLHGASQLPAQFLELINEYGGRIETYAGIPEEQVRQAPTPSSV